MQQENAADMPFFKALLVPYRSLGRTGFLVLMGSLAGAWLCVSVVFFSLGAWPIIGFFGLDVLGLYIAFKWNYRAARVREEILLSRTSLQIRKIGMTGKVEEHSFNPFWTRFDIKRHKDVGVTEMVVGTRNERVPVGEFLNPDDRESFATAFGRALATAKRA